MANGLFLAVTDRGEARFRDPLTDEILLDGVGAAISQSQVVLLTSALIAMAFNRETKVRVLLQEFGGSPNPAYSAHHCVGAKLNRPMAGMAIQQTGE